MDKKALVLFAILLLSSGCSVPSITWVDVQAREKLNEVIVQTNDLEQRMNKVTVQINDIEQRVKILEDGGK